MIHATMLRAAEGAVFLMRVEGYGLDYSVRSLDMIDTRIGHLRQEGETSDSMPATMTALGIYVGEVIRRFLGFGRWVQDAEGYRREVGSLLANPISKCMKRLDNGCEDSVKAFAEAIMLIAKMPARITGPSVKAYVESQMAHVTLEVSDSHGVGE